jgi:hypothetical protein
MDCYDLYQPWVNTGYHLNSTLIRSEHNDYYYTFGHLKPPTFALKKIQKCKINHHQLKRT